MYRSSKSTIALVVVMALAVTPQLQGCATGGATRNIVETVKVAPSASGKVVRLLLVGTSSDNRNAALGLKGVLVGAEIRKQLRDAKVEVFPVAMTSVEAASRSFVGNAVAQVNASHVMRLNIPRGVVLVEQSKAATVTVDKYVVEVRLTDVRLDAVVWSYSANVTAGLVLGASNSQVAESIVSRMRADDLL